MSSRLAVENASEQELKDLGKTQSVIGSIGVVEKHREALESIYRQPPPNTQKSRPTFGW